jgi:Domain of unknown function (DUF4157)
MSPRVAFLHIEHTMSAQLRNTVLKTAPSVSLAQRTPLQRKTGSSGLESRNHYSAPLIVNEVLRSPGQPLDANTRAFMEPRFGHDFSHVRVHTGRSAEESAKRVNALAYTVGRDVVFGLGQYMPGSCVGRELISHELAHVLQQAPSDSACIPPQLRISEFGEDHACDVARAVMADKAVDCRSRPSTGIAIARKESPEAIGAKSFDERVKRIKDLLSYSLFDWVITDSEATEAFQLLEAMSAGERALALTKIRLDRLVDNLPEKFQADLAHIVAESGGEQTVQIQVEKILTYDFFDLIGSVSESDAKQALGLLDALPEDKLDQLLDRLPRDKRRRLHDALPPEGRARFLQMWEQKQERELARNLALTRKIGPGEQFLMRVSLKDTKEPVEAFAPQGISVAVNDDGEVYYAPLETYVNVAGLTHTDAEDKLGDELTSKAGARLLVELKPQPAGFKADYFEAAPPAMRPPAQAQASKADALANRQEEFRALIIREGHRLVAQHEGLQKDAGHKQLREDHEREQDAFNRFYEWFTKNENSLVLLKYKAPELLGSFRADATMRSVKESVRKKIREEKEAQEDSPAVQQARLKKTDEFLHLALSLRGESSRRFPYRIPVRSEGVDILVTGDPSRQAVLNQIAEELTGWSREHLLDDNYTSIDPNDILLYILKSGYEQRLRAADKDALQTEAIDRNEIVPEKVLSSFGQTVALGLFVIAVIGAAVGGGLIPSAVALIFFGAVAAYAGIKGYLDRRKEIEEGGYDVPSPVSALHGVGDALGVSQVIEGITGQRLGIEKRLGSVERSEKLGEGGGGVALLLLGSRAFRFGQGAGGALRLSAPPAVPETLEGVRLEDLDSHYPKLEPIIEPVRNPNPGPIEARSRAALPEELRIGFDRFVERLRRNPKANVEKALETKSPEALEEICKKDIAEYNKRLEEVRADKAARERSASDPLRPRLKHNKWDGNVEIHYQNEPPKGVEIDYAKEIQARTGEPVHVFGDTPSGKSYPAIDGTIGEPPRPLQLKTGYTNAGDAANAATEAFQSAAKHGYSNVEVHVRLKGSTVAEIQAAWNGKTTGPGTATIGWETKLSMARSKFPLSRLVIDGSDGVWVVDAPPPSPNLTGVAIPVPGEKKDGKGSAK